MTDDRARAKAVILRWFDQGQPEQSARRRLSSGIDRFFNEIAERESWSECISTLLSGEPLQLYRCDRCHMEIEAVSQRPRIQLVCPRMGIRMVLGTDG